METKTHVTDPNPQRQIMTLEIEIKRIQNPRQRLLELRGIKRIGFIGMSALKQINLYKKYRPLLPKDDRDKTCPRPPRNVMQRW